MSSNNETRVVGYYAFVPPSDVFRHKDACVVAGSKRAMDKYLASMPQDYIRGITISKIRLGEILKMMPHGAAYVFDEQAYNRFYPLANSAGLDLKPEEFSGPSDATFHFVRVELNGDD